MKIRLLAFMIVALVLGTNTGAAQALWTSAGLDTKITKKLEAAVGAEFRMKDEFSAIERWGAGAGLTYKINKYVRLGAAYDYIQQQTDDRVTRMGNIVPAYWQTKHRGSFDITGRYRWNRFTFSLRERFQYTYRTEQYVPKFDSDGVTPKEDEWVEGVGKSVLRSRLKVDYNIRKSPFKPYATCEFYHSLDNNFELAKTRYTVGSSYRFNKRHSVELFYRYIDRADEDEKAGHVIGVGYGLSL